MRREAEISARGSIRPTRAEIDLDAVVANARTLARGTTARVYAVVKADAYGHGAVPVARALTASGGVAGLMVSLVEEGLELRRGGIAGPVLVMGGFYTGGHHEVLANDLTPVVSEMTDVEAFARAAAAANVRARLHVKVDTGMARLGVRAEQLGAFLDRCTRFPAVAITGLCTHLASADDPDPEPTRRQLARFDAALAAAQARGIRPALVHAANTAATLRFPEAAYDAVRPGLGLYGGAEALGAPGHQAMRLCTAITQLHDLEAGDSVSYGALWHAPARARIATLPIGYADGYPRRLSSTVATPPGADVIIRGLRCPVVGAVCMDMTIVDVTALGDAVAPGDEAVLLGPSPGPSPSPKITAAELAARAGLIEYEITCGISKRVPRIYLGAGQT